MSNIVKNFRKDNPVSDQFRRYIPNPGILINIDKLIAEGKVEEAERTILRYIPNPSIVERMRTFDTSEPVEAPVDEQPLNETPGDEQPLNEAPMNEQPLDEAPADEKPLDEAPVETPAEPVNEQAEDIIEAPADENPTEAPAEVEGVPATKKGGRRKKTETAE